jgi:predicted DNA-binding transcriptional regulator YafY
MSRTARLLELMIAVRGRSRFTVDEMAAEFGVSRRTMLRDLHAVSEMGVPLSATPGPGGGYSLIAAARMPPLSLTVEEAIGIVISYESFLQYADTPFAAQSLSAITKLRNAMPPDIVRRLDDIHACIAIVGPQRSFAAPSLPQLLAAAIERVHLRIDYSSRSRVSERLIFPLGLYAATGFWYLACFDYPRKALLSLRADRVLSVERVKGMEALTDMSLRSYLDSYHQGATDLVPLRATVSRSVAYSYDFQNLFGSVEIGEDGAGRVEEEIPLSEVDFFAARLVAMGPEMRVESPPELIAAMRSIARRVANLYDGPEADHSEPAAQHAPQLRIDEETTRDLEGARFTRSAEVR